MTGEYGDGSYTQLFVVFYSAAQANITVSVDSIARPDEMAIQDMFSFVRAGMYTGDNPQYRVSNEGYYSNRRAVQTNLNGILYLRKERFHTNNSEYKEKGYSVRCVGK